jgi:hypothetical protein
MNEHVMLKAMDMRLDVNNNIVKRVSIFLDMLKDIIEKRNNKHY